MADEVDEAESHLDQQAQWGEGFHDRALRKLIAHAKKGRERDQAFRDRIKALEDRVAALEANP